MGPCFQLNRGGSTAAKQSRWSRWERRSSLSSALAAAGRQAVVQRVAQRLGGLQDLGAARGQRLLRSLPEQLQPGLPAHLGHAGGPHFPPAAQPRLGRHGQASRVHHPTGGGAAGLHVLRGGNIAGHLYDAFRCRRNGSEKTVLCEV